MGFENFEEIQDIREETEQLKLESTESAALEGKLTYIPELDENCDVYGDPFELGQILDDTQGDNIYDAEGDCGLVSITNILKMAGADVSEDDVVGRAIALGLCNYDVNFDPSERGGTNVYERRALLSSYGISNSVYFSFQPEASLERIAEYVEDGRGVNLGINAGYLWNDPNYILSGTSNHSIIVTGTARDTETGELKGFYVCDSGLVDRESSAMFIPIDVMRDAYIDIPGSSLMVTDVPIRPV